MAPSMLWALAALLCSYGTDAHHGFGYGLGHHEFGHGHHHHGFGHHHHHGIHHPVCFQGRATLLIQPIKVVKQTPVRVSAFFPKNTEIAIDNRNTLCVTNAPVAVCTVITKTEVYHTTCANLARNPEKTCIIRVVDRERERIGIQRVGHRTRTVTRHHTRTRSDDPSTTTGSFCRPTIDVTPKLCPNAPTLPNECKALGGQNGLLLVTLAPLCISALNLLKITLPTDCVTLLNVNAITANSKGDDIVNCLLKGLTGNCITQLPNACQTLTDNSDTTACKTALSPFGSTKFDDCFNSSKTGSALILCLNIAAGFANGVDNNGNPCVPPRTGGLGLGIGIGGIGG